MKPISLAIYDQSNNRYVLNTLRKGWNSMPEIFAGWWVRDGMMDFWNACQGAGEMFIDRIEITFDGPVRGIILRSGWSILGHTLIIGDGGEYVPPRGVYAVRWNFRAVAPRTFQYGPVTGTWALSQKRDIFGPMCTMLTAPRATKMWAPYGEAMAAPPGANDRHGVPGHEQDGPGFLLRCDRVMERMPIGCLDQETGQPIQLEDEDYTLDRGWTKGGAHVAFCRAFAVYDDTRVPRVTCPGSSTYRDMMLGLVVDASFTPYNGQHLGNALGAILAAALCGDAFAIFCLRAVVNDIDMAKYDLSACPAGGRDRAWRLYAWAHVRTSWRKFTQQAHETAVRQTISGAILRAPSNYGFLPSPQSYGMPEDWDSDQGMERILTLNSFGLLDGMLHVIKKGAQGMPWPTVKFLGVGANQEEIFPHYQHPCGERDFFAWILLGVLALLEPNGTEWREWCLVEPTPDNETATAHTLAELRTQLRHGERGREQTAVLLSVLEGMEL